MGSGFMGLGFKVHGFRGSGVGLEMYSVHENRPERDLGFCAVPELLFV